MSVPKVLTIAGSDSGGGAGIQADLKTITALGGFGMSVITALTAQNTLGVQGIFEIPPDFVELQFDSVATDIGIDAAKTGMLASADILRAVARKIREYGIKKLVVDPVMVAKGGSSLVSNEAREILVGELLPLALVVTPNIPEAEVIAKMAIANVEGMKKAAAVIHAMGAGSVVVKGGHLDGDAVDIFYDGKKFHTLYAQRIDTRDTHGTGCTFAAAIATKLAQGYSVFEAVKAAKEYLTEAIRFSLRIGGGHGPTNHLAPVLRELDRHRCIAELRQAVLKLKEGEFGKIIPEVQSNLGYALPGAGSVEEVAAFPGRIIRVGERVEILHDPDFGASRHIAGIILTVMRYNGDFRAAMNIRFSEEIIRICKKLGFQVGSFDRSEEPPDVKAREGSSLEWGTDYVLSKSDTVPDAIFDRGDVGKEPMIRILGKTPDEVVAKVISISKRVKKR
jgi:hydroxymethylpyrimidine kinase / phosphomethylpyrimidine kinase / thiamine-phosphate diphosphorylase